MSAIYDQIGVGYSDLRRPDPSFAAAIAAAVGPGSVVNIGAGAGSYEPTRTVAAVEPSPVMVAQRPAGAAAAVRAVAEALPVPDRAFDAALAVLTTHHWSDVETGLREMERVSRRQVVLTWDQAVVAREFWLLADYLPEAVEREGTLASLHAVRAVWPESRVLTLPVPHDCTDGFFAAYWRRPEAYLVPAVRAAISGLALLDQQVVERAMGQLASDLATGDWDRRYGPLRGLDELDLGYRLVVRG